MIKERIPPASPQDFVLAQSAEADGVGTPALAAMGNGPEAMAQLARLLAEGGLPAAAAAVWRKTAAALPTATSRLFVHEALARLARANFKPFMADGHDRVVNRLRGQSNPSLSLPELDGDGYWVRCRALDPEGFAAAAQIPDSLADDPMRDPGFARHLFSQARFRDVTGLAEDYSFLVFNPLGQPVMRVECDVLGDRALGCMEAPATLTPLGPFDSTAAALALRQLRTIAAWAGCPFVKLEITHPDDALPPALAGSPFLPFRQAWIELSQSMDAIRAAYRQTTRHCLRKSEALLDMVEGRDDPDLAVYAQRVLYEGAGRRPALSDEDLRDAMASGSIAAHIGLMEGRPAALVLVSRHGATAYDMASAKIDGCDLPLTHLAIDHAIQRAQQDGAARFDFGPLYEAGHMGGKMAGVASFKRGFAGSFRDCRVFKLFF